MCPLLGNFRDYPHYPALKRAFLAGYRSVRPLPKEYEAYIPLLIATRHATSALWAAGRIRHGGLAPDEAQRMLGHIAYRMGEMRACLAGKDS